MKDLYTACRRLFEIAFPGESPAFADALFARFFPKHLRVSGERGRVTSMLFSIPYPIQTADGMIDARYLYAVATDPDFRGRGLATALIREEIGKGFPLFLRPSSSSLFDFYRKAGLQPFSPVVYREGAALAAPVAARPLSPEDYISCRARWPEPPFCAPTADFLGMGFLEGGAAEIPDVCAAFYERRGDTVCFKEWLGDVDFAPRLTAYLGAKRYSLRQSAPDGTPFGVGTGMPKNTKFMLALD